MFYVLSKDIKILKKNQLKIVIFTAVKNCRILHGHVFVMELRNYGRRNYYKEYYTIRQDKTKDMTNMCESAPDRCRSFYHKKYFS